MMVSFIQSNYAGFGSGVVVPGTGISLQNRGAGFTLAEGHPNRVGPRKRPFHTIIPGFLMKNGRPEMSFGVMGGPMQAQGHVQMVLRTQLWGQDVQTAVDAPRWRFVAGQEVACEASLPNPRSRGWLEFGPRDHGRGARQRLRLWRRADDPAAAGRRICRRVRSAQGRSGGGFLIARRRKRKDRGQTHLASGGRLISTAFASWPVSSPNLVPRS